jgi:RecB family exonuclease
VQTGPARHLQPPPLLTTSQDRPLLPSSTVELVLAHDPLLLLERAAEAFLTPLHAGADKRFPSPPYLLALRQGGLRDDLIRLAAARGLPGWLDPPLCTFQELPAWLGTTGREACDDFERAVILGGVLRQFGGEVFGRLQRPQDFIGALDRLLGELVAEGTSPAEFRAALESRPERDRFERTRDAELQVIYSEYLERLAGQKRRDGRDALLDCAAAVAADPSGLVERLGGRRELRVFGLQDLRGGWRALLKALVASGALDRIVIYTAEELELGLEAVVTRVEEGESVAGRLFGLNCHPEERSDEGSCSSIPDRRGAPGVEEKIPRSARDDSSLARSDSAIAAPDVERELDEVARRIRALADTGVPLHRIAVIARQARPYVDLTLAALERFGVPATARRRVAWSEVPVIRAVRFLLAAAAEGWTRHGLAELAEQPYFSSELDVRLVNYAGFRRRLEGLDAWRRALDGIAQEAQTQEEREARGEETDERRAPLPPASRAREAAEGFGVFAKRAAELDPSRKLSQWLTWLRDFLHADPWEIQKRIWRIPDSRYDIARVDLAGWRGLTTLVDRWCEALDQWGGSDVPLIPEGFYRQFLDLLDGDAALWTPTQRGVQVLEALAAAYRSFDHVFLVGLEAGRFPLPAPTSPILDERERDSLSAAGLPLESRAVWDARERELFRVLVAGARRSLTLSYSLRDTSGREVIPSAFLEALGDVVPVAVDPIECSRVVTQGARLASPEGLGRAAELARIEWGRQRDGLSAHAGSIESPELRAHVAELLGESKVWSPTQLESYAKCPWAYFSGRLLRLDRLEDPDQEMDAATRGSLLHDALSRFFAHAAECFGTPVLLRAGHAVMAIPLAERSLDEALDDARGKKWLGSELLLRPKRLELWRILRGYVEWEICENEKMCLADKGVAAKRIRTAVQAHEVTLGEIEFTRGDIRIRFRGFVDRVEIGADNRFDATGFVAAVDYKTTVYSCPGAGKPAAWRDGVVLQVPLYAYALGVKMPGSRTVRVEYRSLKKPDAVHSLELFKFDRASGDAVEDPKGDEKLETALDAVATHVRTARSGAFPVLPAPSCGCPPFCHAIDICRVPGGPKTSSW